MKKSLIIPLIAYMLMLSNALSATEKTTSIIATKNGINFTQQHLDLAIAIELEYTEGSHFSQAEQNELKTILIEEFNTEPQETINSIMDEAAELDLVQSEKSSNHTKQKKPTQSVPDHTDIATGHLKLRQNIKQLNQRSGNNSTIPDAAYNTPSVNQLRKFIASSQITSSNFNDYSSSKRVFSFCKDGTFRYYYGSNSSITSNNAELSGTNEASASGFWDAYQENGNDALLLFSADPAFLDESLNNTGLLPIPIAAYQEDLIQLGQRGQQATPDLLMSRTLTSGCY